MHGEVEGTQGAVLILGGFHLSVELPDLADVGSEEGDVAREIGEDGIFEAPGRRRTKAAGVAAVLEGVGVAGRGAAFLATRGGGYPWGEERRTWEVPPRELNDGEYILAQMF